MKRCWIVRGFLLHRVEDLPEASQPHRDIDNSHEHHQPDTHIFHHRNQGRCTQPTGIGIRSPDDKGNDERDLEWYAYLGKHHLNAKDLQRDIGHRCQDACDRYQQRQEATIKTFAYKIGRGDIATMPGQGPELGQDEKHNGIHDDRIGNGKEAEGPRCKDESWHSDEVIVPKRRPAKPHSCNRSMSPGRHCAAQKPRAATAAKMITKTANISQLTMSLPLSCVLPAI